MRRPTALLLCFLCAAAGQPSADNGLAAVKAAIATVRATKGINEEREAGPELTPLKHALRAWVETRVATLKQDADLEPVEMQLDAELAAADLTCDAKPEDPHRCIGPDGYEDIERGYVGKVALQRLEDRYLLVTTAVGIRCGTDQSIYLYERKQDRWSLLFASEQDDYAKGHYAPQNFLAVRVSPASVAWNEPAPPPLVLTLGFAPWCSSNWHSIFTRLWRATPATPTPRPLIDTDDTLYMGDYEVAEGSVTSHDALIEFMGRSIDGGVLVRPVVRHYAIGPHDRVRRIAPVALGPDDFVDEWLTGAWKDVSGWTDRSGSAALLRRRHARLHKDFLFGEFDDQPRRCRSDRSLWQVAYHEEPNGDTIGPSFYYLVRWEAPYRFTMVRISERRRRGCDEKDPMPDNFGTLFPRQDWRR
ncbi:MAG TPA: hypothetical protein VFW19_07835 [Allosphingosinicella sp.]|nr:hypothetical protein [Allosphingosinicella sp.]